MGFWEPPHVINDVTVATPLVTINPRVFVFVTTDADVEKHYVDEKTILVKTTLAQV